MATRTWSGVLAAAFALGTLAASCSNPSAEDTKTCEQAADRYVICVEETMGKELADMARGKRDVEACAKSKRTVDWYRDKCLPTKTCEQFMECTMDLAMQEP